jgi:hypothetical protein
MSSVRIQTSSLTNTIYAGKLKGETWVNKTDVTADACAAVAIHAYSFGEPIIVYENGKPAYEIKVKKL